VEVGQAERNHVTICRPSLDRRRRYAPMIVSLLADVFGKR
jgi:hypothetical protein